MKRLLLILIIIGFLAFSAAVVWLVYVNSLKIHITCDGKEHGAYLVEYQAFSSKEKGTLTRLHYYREDYYLELTPLPDAQFNIDSIVWKEGYRRLVLTRSNLELREDSVISPYGNLATYQCKKDPDYAAEIEEHQSYGRDVRKI